MQKKCCSRCGEDKPLDKFPKSKGKVRQPCRKCQRLYVRAHYNKNRKYYLEKQKARKEGIRAWILEIKSKLSCIRCGESHIACTEFHHRDLEQKEEELSNVAGRGWKKERILEEIEKCDVLCSNCHRKLHFEDKTGPWQKK